MPTSAICEDDVDAVLPLAQRAAAIVTLAPQSVPDRARKPKERRRARPEWCGLQDRRRAREAGFESFLVKRVNRSALDGAIHPA